MSDIKKAQRELLSELAEVVSAVASSALRKHTMASADTSDQQAQRFAYNAVYTAFDQLEQGIWKMYAAVGNEEEEDD